MPPDINCRAHNLTYLAAKRAIDVLGSLLGIGLSLPFFPVLAFLIKLDSRGPIFFRQQRIGRGGRLFQIYKFRTMAHGVPEILNPDGSRHVAKDDMRVTRVGKFLRSTSVDELPQLINILRGDMSLVGPRPDQPGGQGLDASVLRKKHSVRPGLTSLASIKGRNAIPWRERVEWELRYVENAALRLDFQILLRTVLVVLRRDGVYCPDVRGSGDRA